MTAEIVPFPDRRPPMLEAAGEEHIRVIVDIISKGLRRSGRPVDRERIADRARRIAHELREFVARRGAP